MTNCTDWHIRVLLCAVRPNLTLVAADRAVHVSAILTGDAVQARHDAVHRIPAANPAMPHSLVAKAVCLTAVHQILHADPPTAR